jgi:hypothetical protein
MAEESLCKIANADLQCKNYKQDFTAALMKRSPLPTDKQKIRTPTLTHKKIRSHGISQSEDCSALGAGFARNP